MSVGRTLQLARLPCRSGAPSALHEDRAQRNHKACQETDHVVGQNAGGDDNREHRSNPTNAPARTSSAMSLVVLSRVLSTPMCSAFFGHLLRKQRMDKVGKFRFHRSPLGTSATFHRS